MSTTPLVERLRAWPKAIQGPHAGTASADIRDSLRLEAADELERLYADTARLDWIIAHGIGVRSRRDGHRNAVVWGEPDDAREWIDRKMRDRAGGQDA